MYVKHKLYEQRIPTFGVREDYVSLATTEKEAGRRGGQRALIVIPTLHLYGYPERYCTSTFIRR